MYYTRMGALAVALWAVIAVAAVAIVQAAVPPPSGPPVVLWQVGHVDVVTRGAGGLVILNLMPVVPMTLAGIPFIIIGMDASSAARNTSVPAAARKSSR